MAFCMCQFLKQAQAPYSISYLCGLLDYCFFTKSLQYTEVVHAQLIIVGLNKQTYLGNRCLNLYSEFGASNVVLKAFDDIVHKNSISWNVCLKGLLKSGQFDKASNLFDEMTMRDVVSWNSMISGLASNGYTDKALQVFIEMKKSGITPTEYTYSILTSVVSCTSQAKQVHGSIVRRGVDLSNLVVGNSLINMYGKLGLVHYSIRVIFAMKKLDVISWNSLILCSYKAGYNEQALAQFCKMRITGLVPDEFTHLMLLSICSDLQELERGKQIFAFCFKSGFIYNSIVASAIIDLFSKCNRLKDSIRLFKELDLWDSAVCNSMISSYAGHGLREYALQFFVVTLKKNLRPTEFTVSCILNSISTFHPEEEGRQIHCLVITLGFQSDVVVASSLMEMYANIGAIDHALVIFGDLGEKDLISWNIITMGLTHNGRTFQALQLFKALVEVGLKPDEITFAAVLLACTYGNFLDEGMEIFSSMEKRFGVSPRVEHYAYLVELLIRGGKIKELVCVLESMPCKPNSSIWKSVLSACTIHGNLGVTESVAKMMMAMEPQSSLPYLILVDAYEMRGRWESIVRMRKAMEYKNSKKVIGCSWIVVKNQLYTFEEDQLHHCCGKDIFLVLKLLTWDAENEGFV